MRWKTRRAISDRPWFERAFAPWPFRFFGISGPLSGGGAGARAEAGCGPGGVDSGGGAGGGGGGRRIEYVARPRGASYDLSELRDWILQLGQSLDETLPL